MCVCVCVVAFLIQHVLLKRGDITVQTQADNIMTEWVGWGVVGTV